MNAYAVVRNEHYEGGDAIGIALTLSGAQLVAQDDCSRRLAVIGLDGSLEWRDGVYDSGPSWDGSIYGRDFSFSYTVTRWEVQS